MKLTIITFLSLTILALSSCQAPSKLASTNGGWKDIATIEGVEIYIDTTSIRHEQTASYATEKRVYVTSASKEAYIDKIRAEYAKMGKAQKADKWSNFSYSVYTCVYECTNSRFRVVTVEDFDTMGKRIAKTTPPKGVIRWLDVDSDTVGDYTTFFVCDYNR